MDKDKTTLQTEWTGGAQGNGVIQTASLNTPIAIPQNKNGSGEGAEPKEILISSAIACFSTTLAAMLSGRKLSVDKVNIETESTDEDDGMHITHYPHVVLSADTEEKKTDSAERAIETADKRCDIGNLLRKAGVHVHTEGKVSIASGAGE